MQGKRLWKKTGVWKKIGLWMGIHNLVSTQKPRQILPKLHETAVYFIKLN